VTFSALDLIIPAVIWLWLWNRRRRRRETVTEQNRPPIAPVWVDDDPFLHREFRPARPLTTAGLFFARAAHDSRVSDYAEWAISQLERDVDSPSLRILAGLDAHDNRFETDMYFRRTLRELQIAEPAAETSVRAYACELCAGIVAGTLEPKDGLYRLYGTWVVSDSAAEYDIWNDLFDSLEWIEIGEPGHLYGGVNAGNFDEAVRTEAKLFLEKYATPHPA